MKELLTIQSKKDNLYIYLAAIAYLFTCVVLLISYFFLPEFLRLGMLVLGILDGLTAVVMLVVYATQIADDIFNFTQERILDAERPLEEPVATNHGESLLEIINGFRKENVEHSAIFHVDGTKICEQTTMSSHSVRSYPPGMSRQEAVGTIHAHSHPSANELSFSDVDIVLILQGRWYQSIVVTRRHLHIMTNAHYMDMECISEEEAEALKSFILEKRQEGVNKTNIVAKTFLPCYIIERRGSIYASRCVAQRLGFDYQIKHIWWENLKAGLRNSH